MGYMCLSQFGWQYTALSSSNCCFLTCIQISQEAGQVVWYFYLFKNFPYFIVSSLLELDMEQQTSFKSGKEYIKAVLSPCLLNVYAEYIMRNAGLDEAQAGIKIAGRNISNLRYADDTTLMAESEEELKSLLMKVKEESEKAGLKVNIQMLRSWHLIPSLHGK